MFALLALALAAPANACSCGRPPFDVVGGPRAVRREDLVHPREAPTAEPDLVVPPSPVLTLTRMKRFHLRPPETVAGSTRFVRIDTGAVIPAITVRRRVAMGIGEGYVQLDVRPAHALEVGATYTLEMRAYTGTDRPDWYGVRLHVTSATPPPAPVPRAVEWEYQSHARINLCKASGWTMWVGDPTDEAASESRYDLFVQAGRSTWRFWGTFAGPLVGNTGDTCANYAFGSDAPVDATRLRIVPRDLGGRPGEVVEITPIPPPRSER